MAKKLSIAQITDFCKSEEVQARIRSYVLELDTQNVLSRYVSYKQLYTFDNEMEYLAAHFTGSTPRHFTYKWVFEDYINSFTIQITTYIVEKAQRLGVTTKKALINLIEEMLSLNNLENIYSLHLALFERADMWFSRLESHFGNDFYNKVLIITVNSLEHRNQFESQMAKCMNDLNSAFPRGLDVDPKCITWVAKHPETFEKIDFSQLISKISFDHYFKEIFKEYTDLAGKKNPKQPGIPEDFMTVRNKEELKYDTEKVFRQLILDRIFELDPTLKSNFSHEYVSNMLSTMMTSFPIFVHILYIQALLNVFRGEQTRMLNDLQKYLDANNIPYEKNGVIHNKPFTEATIGFMGNKFLS